MNGVKTETGRTEQGKKDKEREMWLLTGWEIDPKETPGDSGEGNGSAGATRLGPMRTRPETVAGVTSDIIL